MLEAGTIPVCGGLIPRVALDLASTLMEHSVVRDAHFVAESDADGAITIEPRAGVPGVHLISKSATMTAVMGPMTIC